MSLDYDALMTDMMTAVTNIESVDTCVPDVTIIPAVREKVKIVVDTNLLNENVRAAYKMPISTLTDEILSPPISTTTTLSGILTGLVLDEHDIGMFEPTENVIMIESNFGSAIHHSVKPFVEKLSSVAKRGRKKKTVAKERKKQGTGKCFNSQVTFVVAGKDPDPNTVSQRTELKFKIFRCNKLQLPGAKPSSLDDIFDATNHVLALLNKSLVKPGQPPIEITSLVASMKNYKFYLKLERDNIINLMLLKKILLIERLKDLSGGGNAISKIMSINCSCNEKKCLHCFNKALVTDPEIIDIVNINDMNSPPHPKISDVGYTTEDTKLSLRFHTPSEDNPTKDVLVNIFPGSTISTDYSPGMPMGVFGAKINVLGALVESVTTDIYNYLLYIFETHYDDIVINTRRLADSSPYEVFYDEVTDTDACVVVTIDNVINKSNERDVAECVKNVRCLVNAKKDFNKVEISALNEQKNNIVLPLAPAIIPEIAYTEVESTLLANFLNCIH